MKRRNRARMVGMCLWTLSGGRTAMVVLSQNFFHIFSE